MNRGLFTISRKFPRELRADSLKEEIMDRAAGGEIEIEPYTLDPYSGSIRKSCRLVLPRLKVTTREAERVEISMYLRYSQSQLHYKYFIYSHSLVSLV